MKNFNFQLEKQTHTTLTAIVGDKFLEETECLFCISKLEQGSPALFISLKDEPRALQHPVCLKCFVHKITPVNEKN